MPMSCATATKGVHPGAAHPPFPSTCELQSIAAVIPLRSSSRRPRRRGVKHDEYRDTRDRSRPLREIGRDILDDTLIRFSHLEGGRREVLDASGIGVVIIDMERHVRYANRAALDMLGLSGFDGITLRSIFRDEAAREILHRQLQDRKSGFTRQLQRAGISARRQTVPLEITGLPIPDEHGVVVGSLGLFRNVEQQLLANRIHRSIGKSAAPMTC